jgi:histidinol-phosphate aminotransferase
MNELPQAVFNSLLSGVHRTPEPVPLPPNIIRLDRNERFRPDRQETAEAIFSRLTAASISNYPDTSALHRALARRTSLPLERLLLVPGSDAAFRALAHVFVQPGDRVAMLDPSYQMYPVYARMFGGVPVQVPVRPDLAADFDDLVAQAARSKILWLANPNQPSGTVIPVERVTSLIRQVARAGTLVVVDEAYYPFSGETVIDEVMTHENLIVVRTFSKAFGMAGVRLGFVAGPEAVVNALFKVRASFDINALAIAAGEWALDHPEVIASYVDETRRSAAVLRAVAARHDLWAPPSAANFQLIRVGPRFEPAAVKRACWDRGYAICAPVGDGVFGDYIRVTTGTLAVIERSPMLDHLLNTPTADEHGPRRPSTSRHNHHLRAPARPTRLCRVSWKEYVSGTRTSADRLPADGGS